MKLTLEAEAKCGKGHNRGKASPTGYYRSHKWVNLRLDIFEEPFLQLKAIMEVLRHALSIAVKYYAGSFPGLDDIPEPKH